MKTIVQADRCCYDENVDILGKWRCETQGEDGFYNRNGHLRLSVPQHHDFGSLASRLRSNILMLFEALSVWFIRMAARQTSKHGLSPHSLEVREVKC